MPKIDPHYDYFAITSFTNTSDRYWFEMRSESFSTIKKAVIDLFRKNEIEDGCKVEVRRYSTDKVKQKYMVFNKSKTSVKFVKDDPKVVYKTVTGDDILIELKKLYKTYDHDVRMWNDTEYHIRIEDKNAKQFKKDFIENHKVKAKQINIVKVLYAQWYEQNDDGSYSTGYYNWIIIKDLNELKVKIS